MLDSIACEASLPALPSSFQEHFSSLNATQQEAVQNIQGPLLLLAGAGTGKTRVLTTRLAFIALQRKAWPSEILAVTFTNKAAQEIRERITRLVGETWGAGWLGTFHSIGVRFLRRHGELVGLRPNFTILDADDQLRLVKQMMKAYHWDEKRYPPRLALAIIGRWKDRALTPEKVSSGDLAGQKVDAIYLEIYREYQNRLRTLNAVDFGDLMLLTLRLLTENPDVLQGYQKQFRYILVDEYQDINIAQYLWLRLLAQGSSNIFCVGDDDQSIYGWRGAEVENILRFEKDFPGAKVLYLEENYRSTHQILEVASGLISHNKKRWEKKLKTSRVGGEKVTVRGLWDGPEEARWVGETIEGYRKQEHALSQIAILVRAGFQTREFEERFIKIGIPYRVIGGLRFYERLEIRDALAYLRIVAQPSDSLAFERILGAPKRGLGPGTLQTLHRVAQAEGIPLLYAASKLVQTDELRSGIRVSLQKLLRDISRWRGQAEQLSPSQLAEVILDESGYTGFWQKEKSLEASGRLENLKEFVKALGEFDTLQAFLEHVSLVMEHAEAKDADQVTVMTLHAAKGLEFETVFLTGWEEELFPHPRSLEESGHKGLEEERRLAYVGLTRAWNRAHISFAWNRRLYQGWRSCVPSRFIDELPAEHVQMQGTGGASSHRPSSVPPPAVSVPSSRFLTGQRVEHKKFGSGTIMFVSGNALDIDFDEGGRKKVMATFVEEG